MPFYDLATLPFRQLFPGLRAQLVHTPRLTHSFVEVDEGAPFPEHQHPHEQVVAVLEGELELVVDGVTHRLTPGTVYVIPPDTPHAGRGVTRCRVLDVFAPARDDLKG